MTKLSVNINKVATLRNARGGNHPDVLRVAADCEMFGADGITVHPRPDERHIRYADVRAIRPQITTELNIEGNPIDRYIDLVLEVKPTQVTLVPDAEDQITSNHGWDTKANRAFLTDVVGRFREAGIRTSIFVDPSVEMVGYAKERALCLRLRARPRGGHSAFRGCRRGGPPHRARPQCGSRPEPAEPSFLP